jgi:uroporphyrinogen-III decarboxylase
MQLQRGLAPREPGLELKNDRFLRALRREPVDATPVG